MWNVKAAVLGKTLTNKFAPKSSECVMTGCSEESKAYRLYNANTHRVIVARDVVFPP